MVSIILITHNNLQFTRSCVNSILENSKDCAFELLLFDNNSKDGTADEFKVLAKTYPDFIHVFSSSTNKAHGNIINQLVKASKGDYICILHNDTEVTENWLVNFQATQEKAEIQMPKLVLPNTTRIQSCGQVFASLPQKENPKGVILPVNFLFSADEDDTRANKGFDSIQAVTPGCVFIKKEVYENLGELKESDLDFPDCSYPFDLLAFCILARQKGYKIICNSDIKVYHHGFETLRHYRTDNKIFQRIWRESYESLKEHIQLDNEQKSKKEIKNYLDKKVLVASLVSGGTAFCLDMFLESLLKINFPTENLYLFLFYNNSSEDFSEKIIKWAYFAKGIKRFKEVFYPRGMAWNPNKHQILCDGRNASRQVAKELNADWLFFVDSDVIMQPDSLRNMLKEAEKTNTSIVSGIYSYKNPEGKPLVFRNKEGVNLQDYVLKQWQDNAEDIKGLDVDDKGQNLSLVGPYRLAPEIFDEPGDFAEIDGCPTGLTLVSREIVDKFPFVAGQKTTGTEDLSWTTSIRAKGYKILAAKKEMAYHLAKGTIFYPNKNIKKSFFPELIPQLTQAEQQTKNEIIEMLSVINFIDGWLFEEEAIALFEEAKKIKKDGIIVDLGTYKGKSAVCLAMGSLAGNKASVWTIDHHKGSAEHKIDGKDIDTWNECQRNTEKFKEIIHLIKETTKNAVTLIPEPIDFLFIDASHEYEDVKEDFNLYFPLVAKDGIIAFHDRDWEGVGKLIDEIEHRKDIVRTGEIRTLAFFKKL